MWEWINPFPQCHALDDFEHIQATTLKTSIYIKVYKQLKKVENIEENVCCRGDQKASVYGKGLSKIICFIIEKALTF